MIITLHTILRNRKYGHYFLQINVEEAYRQPESEQNKNFVYRFWSLFVTYPQLKIIILSWKLFNFAVFMEISIQGEDAEDLRKKLIDNCTRGSAPV